METCKGCGVELVRARVWRNAPQEQRDAWRKEGKRRREAPEVCSRCRATLYRPAPADVATRELVLTDWHWLHETGQLSEAQPLAERVRLAAPRMGMTVDALAKALERAGIRNPVEPAVSLEKRRSDCHQCNIASRAVDLTERDLWHVARMLSKLPDNPKLRRRLEEAQDALAAAQAHRECHMAAEHGSAAA